MESWSKHKWKKEIYIHVLSPQPQNKIMIYYSISPWRQRQHAPPKRRSTATRVHGATSQKDVCHLCTCRHQKLKTHLRNASNSVLHALLAQLDANMGTARSAAFRVKARRSLATLAVTNHANGLGIRTRQAANAKNCSNGRFNTLRKQL